MCTAGQVILACYQEMQCHGAYWSIGFKLWNEELTSPHVKVFFRRSHGITCSLFPEHQRSHCRHTRAVFLPLTVYPQPWNCSRPCLGFSVCPQGSQLRHLEELLQLFLTLRDLCPSSLRGQVCFSISGYFREDGKNQSFHFIFVRSESSYVLKKGLTNFFPFHFTWDSLVLSCGTIFNSEKILCQSKQKPFELFIY